VLHGGSGVVTILLLQPRPAGARAQDLLRVALASRQGLAAPAVTDTFAGPLLPHAAQAGAVRSAASTLTGLPGR
jgi:hypothetical protein